MHLHRVSSTCRLEAAWMCLVVRPCLARQSHNGTLRVHASSVDLGPYQCCTHICTASVCYCIIFVSLLFVDCSLGLGCRPCSHSKPGPKVSVQLSCWHPPCSSWWFIFFKLFQGGSCIPAYFHRHHSVPMRCTSHPIAAQNSTRSAFHHKSSKMFFWWFPRLCNTQVTKVSLGCAWRQ